MLRHSASDGRFADSRRAINRDAERVCWLGHPWGGQMNLWFSWLHWDRLKPVPT